MSPVDLLASVPVSTAHLLAAARAAGLDGTVPTCDGWRTRDLLRHTAGVFEFVASVLETGGPSQRGTFPPAPDDEALFAHFAAKADALIRRLQALDPTAEVWNWSSDAQVGAFWLRRMAHEAAVHSVDARSANGEPPAMDPFLASDGIDELLTILLPRIAGRDAVEVAGFGSLHVHCTDVDGEWLVVPSDEGFVVTREHAKGDAALRGRALDLLLRLYGRGDGGEVIGDPGVLTRWDERVRF